MLNQYVGGKSDYAANQAESENERMRVAQTEQLAQALRGGTGVLKPGEYGQYSHPEVQLSALKAALQDKEYQQEKEIAGIRSRGTASYGNTPIPLRMPDGSYALGRFNPEGGLNVVDTGDANYIPDAARMGFDPASILTI